MSAALDLFDGSKLRELVSEEISRTRTIGGKFYDKSLEILENQGSVTDARGCADIYLRATERLGVMLGWNAPQQHAVHLMTQAAAPETSTQQLQRIFDDVFDIGPRERLLEDKDLHGELMTSEEIDELEGFRNEREARDDVKREQDRRVRADRLAARRGNGGSVAD